MDEEKVEEILGLESELISKFEKLIGLCPQTAEDLVEQLNKKIQQLYR